MLRIANKQSPKLGDYKKEWQGFIFTTTFRKSLTKSMNTQQALRLWFKHQSALDLRLATKRQFSMGHSLLPHGS